MSLAEEIASDLAKSILSSISSGAGDHPKSFVPINTLALLISSVPLTLSNLNLNLALVPALISPNVTGELIIVPELFPSARLKSNDG